MHPQDKSQKLSESMRQLQTMSKKRANPTAVDEVFHSLSSKQDLYNHLDKHLQVSGYAFMTDFVVLCMPVPYVL